MKLLLIRHAEPDYTVDGLTPKGKVEAALLAERLLKLPIGDCYQSPKGRAMATAAAYLSRSGKTAETLPWLQEFRGTAFDPEAGKMRICWDYKPRQWSACPEMLSVDTWTQTPIFQGSNVPQVWQETTEGMDALMARYGYRKDGQVWLCEKNTEDTLALFCHFGMSMAILGYLTNISPIVLWHCFGMQPSSVTMVMTEERKPGEVSWRCVKVGDLTHLEANGEPWSTAGLFPECWTGVDSTDPTSNHTRGFDKE